MHTCSWSNSQTVLKMYLVLCRAQRKSSNPILPCKEPTESISFLHTARQRLLGECSRFWLNDLASWKIPGLKSCLRQAGKSQWLHLKRNKWGIFKENFEFLKHYYFYHPNVLLSSVEMSSWVLLQYLWLSGSRFPMEQQTTWGSWHMIRCSKSC